MSKDLFPESNTGAVASTREDEDAGRTIIEFDPALARQLVLARLERRELDDDEAMILMTLSASERSEWEAEQLAQTLLRDIGLLAKSVEAVVARGWVACTARASGSTEYRWRREGPAADAWISLAI